VNIELILIFTEYKEIYFDVLILLVMDIQNFRSIFYFFIKNFHYSVKDIKKPVRLSKHSNNQFQR
jgi:hypothetical protein